MAAGQEPVRAARRYVGVPHLYGGKNQSAMQVVGVTLGSTPIWVEE